MRNLLLSRSRQTKQAIAAVTDFILISFSVFISLALSNFDLSSFNLLDSIKVLIFPLTIISIFFFSGVYRSILRFMDLSTIWLLIVSFSVFCIILILVDLSLSFYGLTILEFLFEDKLLLSSKETFTSSFLLSLFSVVCIRLIANKFLSEENTSIKVAIYGAGSAGIQLAGALRVSHEMQPVAFIDSNKSLHDTFIGGIKVLHPKKLRKLVMRGKIDEVLIAIPSASKSLLRSLLEEIENYSVKVRILPGLAELAQGKVLVSELKEVNVTDLLGRLEIEANKTLLSKNIDGKVVLITGAGGSIGSEISRQVVENNARKIIILDSNEYALYSIKKEIENSSKEVNLYSVLGSVTNKKRIIDICKTFNVDTIYHAAAYKHVPIVEENPFEAVHNNIFGTKSCVEAALESKVETFVLISTDKAVRPTNIMGATKRFSELILQSLSPNPHTRMIMVRFGNVIGSSGSAIPLFQQQIKDGGPVTVTHPEVIRYFMSIPEAAELVIQAGAMGQGGDVFVLDMGEPVKIYKLAEKLIKLSGMELKDKEHQDGDIEIIFTGLRPGEKLYEELLIGDNVSATQHKQILRAEEDYLSADQLLKHLESLKKAEDNSDVSSLRKILEDVVSGYTPESEIVDVVYQQKQ